MRMRAAGAMPNPTWNDDLMALSTALIFDDSVYLSEALCLPVNQNEDDADAQLTLLATESGIQDPGRFLCPSPYISRALSTMTADSDHRSSMSLHSHETESTSFTSAPSRTSRDHVYAKETSPSPKARVPPALARAALSAMHQGPVTQNLTFRPKSAHAKSMSSVTQSALSSTASLLPQQPQQPRRKRASNLFLLFRKDSGSCSSKAHNRRHSKSGGTKLDCGHTLSPAAVNIHIEEALQNGQDTIPNCCGIALPHALVEGIISKEEPDLPLSGDELQSPDLASLPGSGYSENSVSSIELPRSPKKSAAPIIAQAALKTAPRHTRHQEINIDLALAKEAFTSFRAQQKEQFERVAMFECSQWKALSVHHHHALKQLMAKQKASKEERIEQHAQDLERLEERQISAEHDLRQAHEQETQNVATALRHMDAYCLGTNANHPDHPHVVTEEDFKKLDRQRLIQKDLPRKHENAINVLRALQERDTQRKIEKQEAELDTLDMAHDEEKLAEEERQKKELERLNLVIDGRRKRLLQRWDLRFEIWRHDWENQHGTTVTQKLEHEEWPARKAEHLVCIPETSKLARYIRVEP
ncbi:hypothetical protein J1614_007688 [Plenodomus biglobosus]|nr:hypothetical protein J1614_007688 [Plenodomus biglobosus]